MKMSNHISEDNCIHGGFYLVNSRNFYFAVYNEIDKSFYGIRNKFGMFFIFPEIHYDTNEHYGTSQPLKLIKLSPFKQIDNYNECLFEWIEQNINLFIQSKKIQTSILFNVNLNNLDSWDLRIEWTCEHDKKHPLWSPFNHYTHNCDGCCDLLYTKVV